MLRRACALSSGATASSRSSITMSAPSDGAFSSMRTLLPGTASSLRWRRGVWVIEHSSRIGARPPWWPGKPRVERSRCLLARGFSGIRQGCRVRSIHRANPWKPLVFHGSARGYPLPFAHMTPATDLPSLNPPSRLLAGPGPSNVEPNVLAARQKPMLGHLDPDMHEILTELVGFQRQVYNAKSGLVFPHQATGSSGMECGLVNLLEPGDTAIVSVTGFFGNRIARMAERTGAKVVEVRADFGQITPNDQLLDALDQNPDARLVAVVHAETSTGVRHPVEELGAELKRRNSDTLLFVDCVTSLGAHEVLFDEWGFDYAYSCTQKALAAPPGMSPIAISDRALERVAARKRPVPFTFDLDLLRKFWVDRPVTYHHTAPILHIYALYEALRGALDEGLENRSARHPEAGAHP